MRLFTHLPLSAVTLSAFLLVAGCDVERRSAAPAPAPSALESASVKPDPAVDLGKDLKTVPNDASGQPQAKPPKSLAVGDPNPGLLIAKWVKGDPVEEPLKDKVHVVEFWATWCGPCRVGMPHISELQAEYGDEVAFIGVTREDEATVTDFLAKNAPDGRTWDEVIKYRLAIDDNNWTNSAYMRAANQNGIPCAFVVGRDGVVEWIGHPGRIDAPLKKIVEGSWDREAALAD